MKKITNSTILAKIFEEHPDKSLEISELMSNYGLYCIGCPFSNAETLEQGLMAHGYKTKDIKKIISELNKVINKKNV